MRMPPPASGYRSAARGRSEPRWGDATGPSRALLARRAIAFAAGTALTLWLALEGGGFDSIVRQQVALVIWWALAIGLAAGALPRAPISRALIWPAVALAGLILWTVFSFTWTESQEATYGELTRTLGHAGVVCAAWASLNRYTFRAAAGGISVGALAVSALALLSRLAPSDFPVDETAVAFDVDRLSYPFDYWNAVAAWGSASIGIGLVWSAHARLALTRALALAAVPAASLAVYLTYSRAGVIGVAIAVAAALALSRNRWTLLANATVAGVGSGIAILVARGQPAIADATGGEGGATVAGVVLLVALACAATAIATKSVGFDRLRFRRGPRLLPVGVALAVVVVTMVAGRGPISDGWDSFLHDDTVAETARGTERLSSLGGDRDELWGSATDAFTSEALTGIGPGTFEFWWARDGREQAPVEDAHSLYLETMAELGLVGVLLLLGFLSGLCVAAARAYERLSRSNDIGAWAAMLVAFAVYAFHAGVDWMWEYPAIGVLGLGGVAVASTASYRRFQGLTLGGRTRIIAAAIALVAGAVQIPGIVGTERLRESETALARGSATRAIELAGDAASVQGWAASPLARRAAAEEALGDLAAARADLIDAREQESTNWLWAAQLARVESLLGNRAAAERAAADARRLNRVSPPEDLPAITPGG